MRKSRKLFTKTIMVFFLGFLILSIVFSLILNQYTKQAKKQYYYIASSHSNIIANSVDTAISKVYTLNSLLVANRGNTDFFNEVAVLIYDEVRRYTGISLKNISLAPNGVISNVYPYEQNKNLIGFNMMDKSKPGNREAFEAYIRADMVITNPFSPEDGQPKVIAGRLPVFLKNQKGEYKFWGLVSVTIDFNDLIKAIDLSALTKMDIDYCLWYKDQNDKKIILTQSNKTLHSAASYPFKMKNLKWNLDISPKKGWISNELKFMLFLIIIGFSSLISLLYLSHSRIKEINMKLQSLANRDPLTLCYSRNYLNTVLINSNSGAWLIPHMKYSLLIVDIDSFKSVNDTYGHEAGDIAIKKVSEVLRKNIKHEDADCVIRFGGDEFIVLYNDVTYERFISKIEKIIDDTRNIRFEDYPDLRLSLSIGAQPYNKKKPLNYFDQIKMADQKLYTSKLTGKDKYTI